MGHCQLFPWWTALPNDLIPFRPGKSVSSISYCSWCAWNRIGYRSLAPIYFRNSNAAVIVYDITQVSLWYLVDTVYPADSFDSHQKLVFFSVKTTALMRLLQASFEKAKSWVRELQQQADPSIVIMLVGNKLDMESSRRTPKEIGERFAKEENLLFTEASAKSGEGVQELFMEIGNWLSRSHIKRLTPYP